VGKIAITREDIMSLDCFDYDPYHGSMPILQNPDNYESFGNVHL